jgi:PadR family transcriptional regulator PadR
MADKPTDLVQGTLDMLILKTLALETTHGYGIAVRLEQLSKGRFPPQCRFAVCGLSAAATSGIDQKRLESYREQQARKVLRPDRPGTKEVQQRNTRMGKASGGDRQNFGGIVSES